VSAFLSPARGRRGASAAGRQLRGPRGRAVRGFHRFSARGSGHRGRRRAVRPPSPPKRLPKAISVQDVEACWRRGRRRGPLGRCGTGPARAAVRLWCAHLRGGRAGRRRPGRRPGGLGHRAAARQGQQGAGGAGRVVRPRGGLGYLVRGRRLWRRRAAGRRRCSSTPAAAGCPGRARGRPARGCRAGRAAPADLAAHASPLVRHHLLDGGADVRVVQELLGTPASRPPGYTLVTVDRLREVYAPRTARR
jgi:integrase/recombinase XerD